MARRVGILQKFLSIRDVAEYHQDTVAALRTYFRLASGRPSFVARFAGYSYSEVEQELADRVNETDMRSALAVMSRIEAAFRIDYTERCRRKMSDDISIAFRRLHKKHGKRVSLEENVFETWRTVYPGTSSLIGELKGAFKFRHWLAHGRYFQPKLGRKYDYQYIYILAINVLSNFPLVAQNAF